MDVDGRLLWCSATTEQCFGKEVVSKFSVVRLPVDVDDGVHVVITAITHHHSFAQLIVCSSRVVLDLLLTCVYVCMLSGSKLLFHFSKLWHASRCVVALILTRRRCVSPERYSPVQIGRRGELADTG